MLMLPPGLAVAVLVLAYVAFGWKSWAPPWGHLAGLARQLLAFVRPPLVVASPLPAISTDVPEALVLQDAYRAAAGPCVAVRSKQLLVTRLDVIHRVCQDHR